MSALSRYQARLAKIQTQIPVFETAVSTGNLGKIKSYSRGFGLQATTYQDLDSARAYLKWLYSEEDTLSEKIDEIQGTTADAGTVAVARFREA